MGSRSGAFLGMGTWSRSDYLMDIDLSGWRDMNNFGARECGGCFVQHNEYTECLWITNLGKAKIEAIEYFTHFARIKRKMCLIAWVGKQRVLGETGGETVVGSCQASWGAQVLLTVKFCLLSCISRHSYFREYHCVENRASVPSGCTKTTETMMGASSPWAKHANHRHSDETSRDAPAAPVTGRKCPTIRPHNCSSQGEQWKPSNSSLSTVDWTK